MNARAIKSRVPPRLGVSVSRLILPLVILLVSLLLLRFVPVITAANRLQVNWQTAQSFIQTDSLTIPAPEQFKQLDTLLAQSQADIREVRSGLGPLVYLAPLFGWVPRYGADIADAPALLELAEQGITGGRAALALGQAIQENLDPSRGSETPKGQVILQTVQSYAQDIREAQSALEAATRARASIDAGRLTPSVQRLIDKFDRVLPQWQTAMDGIALAPQLLGADRPRLYLVMFQNSDELRPSGGFIAGAARLSVDQGKFELTDFRDSYAVDNMTQPHPQPPAALYRYMQAGMWLFRDANWSPDFPTAASIAAQLYGQDQGVKVDGVIALNAALLPSVMQAVVPVTLDAYKETIDENNVTSKLQEYWASPQGAGQTGDWWSHRKDFLGELLGVVMTRIQSGEFDTPTLARVLVDSVKSKDILIYIDGSPENGHTNVLNGGLKSARGDALMIVDSNVGFNKVDANMDRAVEYIARVNADGGATSTLTVNFTNKSPASDAYCVHAPRYMPTYAEMQRGCYWNYERIILAPQAQFTKMRGVLEGKVEDPLANRTVLSGYFLMAGGEKRQVIYDYITPRVLDEKGAYRLSIEKQPGMHPLPLKVRVELPANWSGISARPPSSKIDGQTVEFELTLDRDQEIVIMHDGSPIGMIVLLVIVAAVAGLGGWLVWRKRNRPLGSQRPQGSDPA